VFSILTWLTVCASLIGVVLNIRKRHACFYIWSITNAIWMFVDLYKQIYAQAVLFFIYFILALWGIYEWKIKEPKVDKA
jgi:nicotinamide riboside transporter PnuC